MKTKGYVYVQMNQFYTATIRDTDSLKHYLDRANNGCKINFIDNTFGTIHSVSEDVSKGFLKEIQKIIKYQKGLKNSKMVEQIN